MEPTERPVRPANAALALAAFAALVLAVFYAFGRLADPGPRPDPIDDPAASSRTVSPPTAEQRCRALEVEARRLRAKLEEKGGQP